MLDSTGALMMDALGFKINENDRVQVRMTETLMYEATFKGIENDLAVVEPINTKRRNGKFNPFTVNCLPKYIFKL